MKIEKFDPNGSFNPLPMAITIYQLMAETGLHFNAAKLVLGATERLLEITAYQQPILEQTEKYLEDIFMY